MEFRSTNLNGFVHYQGDVVTNVSSNGGSSHGVHLTGGSTGGIVTAAGDEANIALNVGGKGTGPTRIGNSSSPIVFPASTGITISTGGILQVGSTAPFGGFVRVTSSFATPNFATTNAMVMESTHAITGVNSSHYVLANGINLSTDCCLTNSYPASTAGEVHCRFVKASTLTVAATSASIRFLITRF
jgi:hypothetical protein